MSASWRSGARHRNNGKPASSFSTPYGLVIEPAWTVVGQMWANQHCQRKEGDEVLVLKADANGEPQPQPPAAIVAVEQPHEHTGAGGD
jgi:hypothetical protein